MKPYWLSEHGFTLLEVVVAIVIITTLVATFGPLIASSVRNIKWSGLRMQALYSMRGVMERKLRHLMGLQLLLLLVQMPPVKCGSGKWKAPL